MQVGGRYGGDPDPLQAQPDQRVLGVLHELDEDVTGIDDENTHQEDAESLSHTAPHASCEHIAQQRECGDDYGRGEDEIAEGQNCGPTKADSVIITYDHAQNRDRCPDSVEAFVISAEQESATLQEPDGRVVLALDDRHHVRQT